MVFKPTIAIDFDGTLSEYESWTVNGTRPGPPIPGALEKCKEWAKRYRLVIMTVRDDLDVVRQWVKEHGFPIDEVTNRKVPALAYVDDRAVRFNGFWNQVFDDAPRCWWQKDDIDD